MKVQSIYRRCQVFDIIIETNLLKALDLLYMLKHSQQLLLQFIIVILYIGILTGQNVPIPMNHPVNDFILRILTRHKIEVIHPGIRPFTVNQILEALDKLSTDDYNLSSREKSLLMRFKKEFAVLEIEHGIQGPWQSKQISTAIKNIIQPYDSKNAETRFISYHDDNLLMWADWEEIFSIDIQDTIQRAFYNDRVTISGKFTNQLSFHSKYSLFRIGYKEGHPLPEEFKQGYALIEENTDWLVWDVSEASLHFKNVIMNAEISKIPIYWGFSKKDSPVLSANVQSFSFFRFSKDYKRIRVQSFMGSLDPFGDNRKGSIEGKHIAAHRFEIDLTSSLTVSFNEMVIYARRNIELGYLLPINLFWSEEHGLGNRDNVLMSFDAMWNAKPGLSIYGTVFWDELSWFKLLSPWWGNKFIFQSGLHWVPFANPQLPDFRIEWTASRPWVYTHNDSLLTFTSSEIGLGFPLGPNSQLLYLEMNMWPTYKIFLSLNVSYLKKGSGIGSDPNDNYSFRNEEMDDTTPMLIGNISESTLIGLKFDYRLTQLVYITGKLTYDANEEVSSGRIGLLMNY